MPPGCSVKRWCPRCATDGHEVTRLVRRPAAAPDEAQWDPSGGHVDPAALAGADAVIHLAGPGMGDRPWTPARKRLLLDDRVSATRTIAAAMAAAEPPPRVLLSMSGIGYYGNPGEQLLTEQAPKGDGYVAQIAAAWEDATAPPPTPASGSYGCAPGWCSRPPAARSAGCCRSSGSASVVGSARAGSGGAGWRCPTTSPPCGSCSTTRRSTDRSTSPHPSRSGTPISRRRWVACCTDPPSRSCRASPSSWRCATSPNDLLGGQRAVPRRLLDAGFTFEHPSFEPALRAVLTTA